MHAVLTWPALRDAIDRAPAETLPGLVRALDAAHRHAWARLVREAADEALAAAIVGDIHAAGITRWPTGADA